MYCIETGIRPDDRLLSEHRPLWFWCDLTPIEREIYDLLRKRPRRSDQIRDHVWQLRPNGPPSFHSLYTHVWRLRKKLKARGIVLKIYRGTRTRELWSLHPVGRG